jgi:flagellar biosynthesis protein FlhG
VAAAALRSFRPGLIINRTAGRSQVNVLYLRKILQDYVGGDLMMLGEIPEDPAVSQAVRKFLPVIEFAPQSPAAKGLLAVSAAVEQLAAAEADKRKERQQSADEVEHNQAQADPGSTLQLLPLNRLKPESLPSVCDLRSFSRADTVPSSEESKTNAPLEGTGHEESRPKFSIVL